MTLHLRRDEAGLVVTSVPETDAPQGNWRIDVHYTLCSWGEELKAVTCVGSMITEGDDDPESVALFTSQISDVLTGDDGVVTLEGGEQPEAAWTLVPVAAQVLTTLKMARVGMGWSGVVVGSGILPEILMGMGSNIGARHLIQVAPDEIAGIADTVDATQLFFSAGLDNRELTDLMSAMPEQATIALVEEIAGPPVPINFYDTIHKKSLTVITPSQAPVSSVYRRAQRLIDLRPTQTHPVLPVHEAKPGESLELPNSPTVIVQWR